MKKILPAILVAFLAWGCTSNDKDLYSRQIAIQSNPTGIPIVINGLKMGTTPFSVGVETNELGCFVRKTVITAIPLDGTQHTQVVSFPPYRDGDGGNSITPQSITFDMTKSPAEGGGVVLEND